MDWRAIDHKTLLLRMMHLLDEDEYACADNQYACSDDEMTILDACIECDMEALQNLLDDCPTYEEVNERDRSGRTGLSHACSNGFVPIVDVLSEIPEVDVNLPDNEGNTPLIFAVQAGHADVVRVLLRSYRRIKVDQTSKAGFSALMKAALQGRTKCAKLLLIAGASQKNRDHGRRLCAEEWARFCGRHDTATAISKFRTAKNFFLKPRIKPLCDKSRSEPDLTQENETKPKSSTNGLVNRPKMRPNTLGRTFRRLFHCDQNTASVTTLTLDAKDSVDGNAFAIIARCVSTPLIPQLVSPTNSPPFFKRPRSADNLSTIPKLEVTSPTGILDEPVFTESSPSRFRRRRHHSLSHEYHDDDDGMNNVDFQIH